MRGELQVEATSSTCDSPNSSGTSLGLFFRSTGPPVRQVARAQARRPSKYPPYTLRETIAGCEVDERLDVHDRLLGLTAILGLNRARLPKPDDGAELLATVNLDSGREQLGWCRKLVHSAHEGDHPQREAADRVFWSVIGSNASARQRWIARRFGNCTRPRERACGCRARLARPGGALCRCRPGRDLQSRGPTPRPSAQPR